MKRPATRAWACFRKMFPRFRPPTGCRTWDGTSFAACGPASCSKVFPDDAYFYFAHSYAALDAGEAAVAFCDHSAPFVAVLEQKHVFATQFHPEKSGPVGAQVLSNFVRHAGERR